MRRQRQKLTGRCDTVLKDPNGKPAPDRGRRDRTRGVRRKVIRATGEGLLSRNRWYVFAAVWGLIDAVAAILMARGQHLGFAAMAGIVVDVVALALLFLAGRQAKAQGRPAWRAGLTTGVVFGLFAGWSSFFVVITRQTLAPRLKASVSSANIDKIVRAANTPPAHVAGWVEVIILWLLLGLLAGFIGGLATRAPASTRDV